MSVEQYWMGKGLDLDGLWRDFDSGSGYMQKVAASPLHLLRLTFAHHPLHLPLFDHEVVFKTVKGTFHDVKAECLTPETYNLLSALRDYDFRTCLRSRLVIRNETFSI